MLTHGFSHIGLTTHDMDATIAFYDGVLGFRRIADDLTQLAGSGTLRQVYFAVGPDQYIVFMEPKDVDGIPADFDTSINGALGLPRGMYHFAFKVATLDDLELRRQDLDKQGIDASPIIDLDTAKSVFCFDPNGVQLEFSCHVRAFNESDLARVSEATLAQPD